MVVYPWKICREKHVLLHYQSDELSNFEAQLMLANSLLIEIKLAATTHNNVSQFCNLKLCIKYKLKNNINCETKGFVKSQFNRNTSTFSIYFDGQRHSCHLRLD